VSSPLDARRRANLLAPLGGARRHLPSVLFGARVLNLLVMLALIYIGLGITDTALAFTNLTSFLVWNVWWPFLVIAVFFAARLWCGICHLRLTADIFDKYGLKRKVPRMLKKYGSTVPIATVVGIFVVHSVVVSYGVPEVPSFTAIFLIALMVYAMGVGLLFEKHSFCKYFCPLIGILGNYTRVSPTELRSADPAQCKRCKDKECIKNCQNRLYMGTMDDEQQESCLLCMRCVKHCPHDNIRFSLRPYLRGLWQSPKRTLSGTFAVVVLLGIVTGEVGENWALVDRELLFVPGLLTRLMGFETILPIASGQGFLIWETIWVFVVQPLVILGACGVIAYLLVRKRKPLEYVQIYALGLLPLILSLHAAKLVTALDDNGRYLSHALADPYGFATARAIAAGTLAPPPGLIPSPTVFAWLLIAFVAGFGVLGSLYATWRIARVSFVDDRADGVKTALPFFFVIMALGIVAVLTIYSWRLVGGG
jgi:polyferredoxin